MITTSDKLSELARAIGLSAPQEDMSAVIIPSVLAPTLEYPLPFDFLLETTTTEIMRRSWNISFSSIVPASTAQATTILCTLGRGLWDLTAQATLFGNFTSAQLASEGSLQMIFPTNDQTAILRLDSNALGPTSAWNKLRVLLANDTTRLGVTLGATAVAQTYKFSFALHASKLL